MEYSLKACNILCFPSNGIMQLVIYPFLKAISQIYGYTSFNNLSQHTVRQQYAYQPEEVGSGQWLQTDPTTKRRKRDN